VSATGSFDMCGARSIALGEERHRRSGIRCLSLRLSIGEPAFVEQSAAAIREAASLPCDMLPRT